MSAMGEESLQRLKGLHLDLVNITESRLPNIDRLVGELETRIDEFRTLLDKTKKNDKSRQIINSGKLSIDEEEFSINEDFKQDTIQLSDFLDLDEVEAARLYNNAIFETSYLDRQPLVSSIVLFHERRQYQVECLRLCVKIAAVGFELEDDTIKAPMQKLISFVLEPAKGQTSPGGPAFFRKVLSSMSEIEHWLQALAERIRAMIETGQSHVGDLQDIMSFQRTSLMRQHESLGAIAYHLVDAGYLGYEDCQKIFERLKALDRYDLQTVHYLPSACASITSMGANEVRCSRSDASKLNSLITSGGHSEAWRSRPLQSLLTCVWLAEYNARFADDESSRSSPSPEAGERSRQFLDALRDGAFQYLLSVAQDVKVNPWFDPLRRGITSWLVQDFPTGQADAMSSEPYFQDLLMDQLQNFVEAFITNMPDALRTLRFDEDEQRRNLQGRLQIRPSEYPLHLERFYMIAAYAFEGFEAAAENFWNDTEGNLHGFLVWASQRQPTPRVATFCELLRALSFGEVNANHVHDFLLEGKNAAKIRRSSPLGWHHIIDEIEFCSSNIKDRPALQPGKAQPDQILVEEESGMMLECYLRLVAHLCQESPKARQWLLTNTDFAIHEHLMLLCSSSIESKLRGNAFAALASLLIGKTREVGDGMWAALDAWVCGSGATTPALQRQSNLQAQPAAAEKAIFDSIATEFEEPNAFVNLLCGLVAPYHDEQRLNDTLPFPESLGAAYRMPGIGAYVDFVMGRVFAGKTRDLQDPIQIRILRYTCLRFIATCLSGFNEELVVFANKSSIAVDSAMRTSSLSAYVKLHPFARIMEWLFNDGVLASLFEAVNQDISEVSMSQPESPLVLGLLEGIRVISLAMSLQSTYFDVVRPIIKLLQSGKRAPVANSALASFEDAILNNLALVTNLGLYSGSGHEHLAIISLQLLQKLATSRKLVSGISTGVTRQLEKNRLITSLEREGNAEVIARSLIAQMQVDERTLEQGPGSPSAVVQQSILMFLSACLNIVPDRPTVAHSLLGFRCHTTTIDVSPESVFVQGGALFHTLMQYMASAPDGDQGTLKSWLLAIKAHGANVFSSLLKSPLSARLTLEELRSHDYLIVQWAGLTKVGPKTLWDGKTFDAQDFYIADSGAGYIALLQLRCALIDHAALELRFVNKEGLASLQTRIMAALMGEAVLLDGLKLPCPTLFDLVDFLDVGIEQSLSLLQTKFFSTADFAVCWDDAAGKYDLGAAEQLLLLRTSEMRSNGQIAAGDEQQEQQLLADQQNVLGALHANNRRFETQALQTRVLKSWTLLVVVFLSTADFDTALRNTFILQCLQVITPRLEASLSSDTSSALLYAQLSLALLQHLDIAAASPDHRLASETTHDRLFTIFRVALSGVQDSTSSTPLRLTCAQICQNYLRSISKPGLSSQRTLALQSVKSRGQGLMEVLCDEAYSGEEENRIAALLLLGVFVATSNQERSKYMVEALSNINFINVLVSNFKSIPQDFQNPKRSDTLTTLHKTSLHLLLLIAQTRQGATALLTANFFACVRDSGLFSTDPDLGLGIEDDAAILSSTAGFSRRNGRGRAEAQLPSADALTVYYQLLTAITRIILACLISKGSENEGMMKAARAFLSEYRSLVVGVFKRSAGVGLLGRETLREETVRESEGIAEVGLEKAVGELAEVLTVLVGACGWLEEEGSEVGGGGKRARGSGRVEGRGAGGVVFS